MHLKSIIVFSLTLFISLPAVAAGLHAEHGRVPEAPPVAPVMAGYLDLVNSTSKPLTVTRASSPAFERVEIHRMSMKDGMMHMEQLQELTIPARGRLSLSPGGYHLMLIKPKKSLNAGDIVEITLQLANVEHIRLKLPVEKDHEETHSHH